MFLFSFVITATKAQQFTNGDLNGTIPCSYSTLPTNWLNVPYTDVNSIASDFNLATCDLTYLTGPVFSTGVNGNPFHGTTFVSGGLSIIGPTNSDTADEGIMQTVSGFTIGNTYSINFYQAVVKQLGL